MACVILPCFDDSVLLNQRRPDLRLPVTSHGSFQNRRWGQGTSFLTFSQREGSMLGNPQRMHLQNRKANSRVSALAPENDMNWGPNIPKLEGAEMQAALSGGPEGLSDIHHVFLWPGFPDHEWVSVFGHLAFAAPVQVPTPCLCPQIASPGNGLFLLCPLSTGLSASFVMCDRFFGWCR